MTRVMWTMLVGLVLSSACAQEVVGDPQPELEAGPCATEADVTWDSFADGFFTSRCQACHASATPDRRGAPADVTFDDEESALEMKDRVRARVIDEPSMPPGGGISDDERALLDVWLRCRPRA